MLTITREQAYRLRELIEKAVRFLSDEDALDGVALFPAWKSDTDYSVGERIKYGGKLYRVVQAHTSQETWTPDITPALYTEVAMPGEIPVWRQPSGVQDAYQTGDRVRYPDENGSIYESEVDNNVWSPAFYGWRLIE